MPSSTARAYKFQFIRGPSNSAAGGTRRGKRATERAAHVSGKSCEFNAINLVRELLFDSAPDRRDAMEQMVHFAGLLVTTVFAAAAAVALDWLLLKGMFQLMRPAAVRRPQVMRAEPASARREVARQLVPSARL